MIDMVVDIFFMVDIIINFISAYEDPDSGFPIVDLKYIAGNYITSWFFIDFIAVFPTA